MLRRHIVLLIAWRPPLCSSRRADYDSAPGFTFSLPIIIIPHNKITLHKHIKIHIWSLYDPSFRILCMIVYLVVPIIYNWTTPPVSQTTGFSPIRSFSSLMAVTFMRTYYAHGGQVENFKYLGITVTNTNDVREEIKRRIDMGNACYSLEKILSSCFLSKKLKVNTY